jgi:guanyl-specific ribonuclease Sa
VIVTFALCGMLASEYGLRNSAQHAHEAKEAETNKPNEAPAKPPVPSTVSAKPASPKSSIDDALIIRNVVLRDQDREEIYRGDIDLRPTVERIVAGCKLRFSNDGSTFQNREGRLPKHPSGYYREWVVPTPGESGPGPQRIVTGAEREAWYTHDHYHSFRRLPSMPASPKGGVP